MATLSLQSITTSGLNPSLVAADAGGDTFDQTSARDQVFLYVNNGGAGAIQVTVTAANTSKEVPNWGSLTASDAVVSVPIGEFRLIGPFPTGPYTTTPDITYDDVSSVTVGAIRLPKV